MRRSPRNVRIACNHRGLTHFGGAYFFHEFLQLLQIRDFLSHQIPYPRRNHRYSVSQMLLALIYPIVLGLDRIEAASFLRSNGTFQYLTGLPAFPDPQTLRRFLLNAPAKTWEHLHRANDRLLQKFLHLPKHRSRLIFDLDGTVVTVFGRQDGAEVGYNPKYRGKRSYNPLLCLEANSSFLWDAELRPGNASAWESSPELLKTAFGTVPPDIRELRFRADAGFGFQPVLQCLEESAVRYALVARLTSPLKNSFRGLDYQRANSRWELSETEYRAHGWSHARRIVVARRLIEADDQQSTLFAMGRYLFRAWTTNLDLTPEGVWRFYEGRAAMEPRMRELREDFALPKIPTGSFDANALYLEVIRLAYNLVTAFQRTCLPESWQCHTLQKLRFKLFLLPAELTRPQNRPTLRLKESPPIQRLVDDILGRIHALSPL
ncbi:MAG: IS1380 family transposase [Acidobacteria bacterium]|nr:IS1380 family transposase [Acidobacteriota bacterium]